MTDYNGFDESYDEENLEFEQLDREADILEDEEEEEGLSDFDLPED